MDYKDLFFTLYPNFFERDYVKNLPEEYNNYINGRACKNGVFSDKFYREVSFNPQKHEFLLAVF